MQDYSVLGGFLFITTNSDLLYVLPSPWFLEWCARLNWIILKLFIDKVILAVRPITDTHFSLSGSCSNQMHFWCIVRTQLSAPVGLSVGWLSAAARGNCLLLWKLLYLAERCLWGRATLLYGRTLLFRYFCHILGSSKDFCNENAWLCAFKVACEPSIHHYYHGTSMRNLNASWLGRLC